MALRALRQIKTALAVLSPGEVRKQAERPITLGLWADDGAALAQLEDFLTSPDVSTERRLQLAQVIFRAEDPGSPRSFDLEICDAAMGWRPRGAFTFHPHEPERTVEHIVATREDLHLALASRFPAFRRAVVKRVIHRVSKENAALTLVTALPNVLPSWFEIPWAFAEFASDTAVLTANQVRMAFLLAAASDRPVGYREQKSEIATIIAGAFGWRALARELVGKIPFGGGLIAKASVAYAGTFVMGSGIERVYRIGYGYTRAERRAAFDSALHTGKKVATAMLDQLKKKEAAAAPST